MCWQTFGLPCTEALTVEFFVRLQFEHAHVLHELAAELKAAFERQHACEDAHDIVGLHRRKHILLEHDFCLRRRNARGRRGRGIFDD